ncbi:hypothetical protein BdWA1_001499 [Babesia duncani]|nr:hypothetical protein BdWA1_001499 [Babesia duncani]
MTVIGLAFEFAIYPVICPILTVESSRHHTIILWALLIEFSSGVIVFLLTLYADIRWRWIKFKDYPRQYYNFLWLFLIPFLGFGLSFLWALHHPSSGFSNALRYGVWGGILTCVYYISAENTTNVGFACMFHHAYQGAGGLYHKYVKFDDVSGAFSESNNKVELKQDNLNIAFGDLSTSDQSKYQSEFKKVFNDLKEINVDSSNEGKISDDDITQIKNSINSHVSNLDIQTACFNAFKKTYERAFKYVPKEGHIDTSDNKLKTGQSSKKTEIIEALKSLGLSDAEAEAYIQGYNASSTDNRKSGSQTAARFALAKVAAAEKHAKGGPEDIPVSPSASKNAGYAMTFGIFWNNLFSVYFLYLMDAHLANFFMYTGKLAEGHVFPTASMNGFRSCWFWFSCASSGAWKNFISMFNLDIKEMLLS